MDDWLPTCLYPRDFDIGFPPIMVFNVKKPPKNLIRALQHAAEEFFSDPLQLALHEKRVDQEQDPDASSSSSFSRSEISWGTHISSLLIPSPTYPKAVTLREVISQKVKIFVGPDQPENHLKPKNGFQSSTIRTYT